MLYHHLKCIMIFFQKEKNYDFGGTIDIKGSADKFYMYTYLTLTLFMLLTLLESISFVKAMVLKRNMSLLCYHLIIKFC